MKRLFTIMITVFILFSTNTLAEPLGTGFTYQGELQQTGATADGAFDFEFNLYTALSGGSALTAAVRIEDVNVQNGVFTVELDFGPDVFDGTQLWLGVAVRDGASLEAYTTLDPRQKLTASPYAAVAQDSTNDTCTAITGLPYTISAAGVYCFTGNLETSITTGYAITINADNVVIDLNSWRLSARDSGTAAGIYARQRKNIIIRNGTISGFFRGILLSDVAPFTTSKGHLIEDIRAENSTYAGIQVEGSNNIARRNQVVDSICEGFAYGIRLRGPAGRALDNDIVNITTSGSYKARGIFIYEADGAIVEGNRIVNLSSGGSTTYGLGIENSDNVLVRSNSISSADYGIYYASSTGKYMDNLTDDVTTAFLNGTAVGFNN